jgi:hypothetical protein
MNKHVFLTTAAIISLSLLVAGCTRRPEPVVDFPPPTAVPDATLPLFPDDLDFPATPSATPKATTPAATPKAVSPDTKGGQAIVTPKPQAKPLPPAQVSYYDTDVDTIEVRLNHFQSQQFSITLKNDSNSPVMYAVRAEQKPSATFPVGINDSNETTGTINAHSTSKFTITVRGTQKVSDFSTNILVNFVKDGRVAASRPIKVTVHTFADNK